MSTCNQLDLETLGSRPIMHKNLPGYLYQAQLSQGKECSQIMQRDLQHIEICPWQRALAVYSKLRIITLMATKVHMILRSFVAVTWMRDTIELV